MDERKRGEEKTGCSHTTEKKMLIRSDLKWITWCAPRTTTTTTKRLSFWSDEGHLSFFFFFISFPTKFFSLSVDQPPFTCSKHKVFSALCFFFLFLSFLSSTSLSCQRRKYSHSARMCFMESVECYAKGERKTINEMCGEIGWRWLTWDGASNWHIIFDEIIESRVKNNKMMRARQKPMYFIYL